MHQSLREKYNINTSSPTYTSLNNNESKKKYKCGFTCGMLVGVTILNTIYIGLGLYFYKKYIYNTFLNDTTDINLTYNKLKYLTDFACNTIPNIHC